MAGVVPKAHVLVGLVLPGSPPALAQAEFVAVELALLPEIPGALVERFVLLEVDQLRRRVVEGGQAQVLDLLLLVRRARGLETVHDFLLALPRKLLHIQLRRLLLLVLSVSEIVILRH